MAARAALERWDDAELCRALVEAAPDATVIVDAQGLITLINSQTERLFGYPRAELVGKVVEVLLPERLRASHAAHRARYAAAPTVRPMGVGLELLGRRQDGLEFPVEISLSPLQTDRGMLFCAAIRDITERKRAEEKLRSSLREKEVLLKEIHHRVKNNLQITSSMLKLQSAYITDLAAREVFAESQNRIRSMALVHEKLYRSRELSRVDLGEYARELADLLFRSYGVDCEQIALEVCAAPVFLGIDAAVPCGLILNEALSNCLKHAFPADRSGHVKVSVSADAGGAVAICVQDDGVGLPANLDLDAVETLGFELVKTLVEQLRGQLEIDREGGTTLRITFLEHKA